MKLEARNKMSGRSVLPTCLAVGSIIVTLVAVGAVSLMGSSASRRSEQSGSGGKGVNIVLTPSTVPYGVDPKLWNARQVSPMPALTAAEGNAGGELWGITEHGHLVRSSTTDQAWQLVNSTASGLDQQVLGVTFDGNNGWLLGSNSIDVTSDEGQTWSALPALPSPAGDNITLQWASMTGPSAGYGITNLDQLEETTNGGDTWNLVSTPVSQVEGACFVSPEDGLIVSDSPSTAVFETSNAGSSWVQVFSTNAVGQRAQLDCPSVNAATLRLDLAYGPSGIESETYLVTDGWKSDWSLVSGNTSGSANIGTSTDTGVVPSLIRVTGTSAASVVTVGSDGSVLVGSGSVDGFASSSITSSEIGSIGASNKQAVGPFDFTSGVASLGSDTYVFAASDETGRIVSGVNPGTGWSATSSSLP